jgi:hypothetical protein
LPDAVPVTFTLKVQEPLAATVAPLRLIVLDPAVAVMVPPPHEPVSPLGVATTRPLGRLSVNATPVSVTAVFEFVIVKLRVVVPFSGMVDGVNDFAMAGGATTMMLVLDVLPVPPSRELTVTLLFLIPADVPVTFTVTVQEPLAATVPPDRLTVLDPATAVVVPPHVLFRLGVDATTRPLGRLSVKAMFD